MDLGIRTLIYKGTLPIRKGNKKKSKPSLRGLIEFGNSMWIDQNTGYVYYYEQNNN